MMEEECYVVEVYNDSGGYHIGDAVGDGGCNATWFLLIYLC